MKTEELVITHDYLRIVSASYGEFYTEQNISLMQALYFQEI